MTTSSAQKPAASVLHEKADAPDWTRLQQSFVAERIRSLMQLPSSAVRGQVRDLCEHAPARLIASELSSALYLVVNTPESGSLDTLVQVWEALDLPMRRSVRDAFQKTFGGTIRAILGHRLPAHLQAAFSW